jgi:hypothetical protein
MRGGAGTIATTAEPLGDAFLERVMRNPEGSRAGTARSIAATMRSNCAVSAKAATRQMRGSLGPEKRRDVPSDSGGVSKSSAISMGVRVRARAGALLTPYECRTSAAVINPRAGYTSQDTLDRFCLSAEAAGHVHTFRRGPVGRR